MKRTKTENKLALNEKNQKQKTNEHKMRTTKTEIKQALSKNQHRLQTS